MYESPRLVPMNTINAAYGYGALSMGFAVVTCNLIANVNAGANAVAAANAVVVTLVVNHYSPLGSIDPRAGAVPEEQTDPPSDPATGP